MIHCSNCGKEIRADSSFCTYCGAKIDISNIENRKSRPAESTKRKYIIWGAMGICFIVYFFVFRCKAGFCPLPSSIKGDYCSIHACQVNGCENRKAPGKNYCYTHSPSSPSVAYTPEKAENVLNFSNVTISHNSSYTVCTGTITNNGKRTYTFVEIKGKFQSSSGIVLDSDWTYAVGSEGLAPGESATFRMSVPKNLNITKCTIDIIDYDRT